MSNIKLMFHDVFETDRNESGFQNSGALKYKLSKTDFVSLIQNFKDEFEYTFDDGGVSSFNIIAPILEDNGLKGVFCITTGLIGTSGFMDESQIRSLSDAGHEIISHSHSHLSDIAFQSKDVIYSEWIKSKNILESLTGGKCVKASIPGGSISIRLLNVLSDLGFETLYTSLPFKGSFKWKNLCVYGRLAIYNDSTEKDIIRHKSLLWRTTLTVRFLMLLSLRVLFGSYYYILREKILK